MKNIRVKARVAGPDDNGIQRSIGEIFTVPEEARARKLARDGFLELIDNNGAGITWDAPIPAPEDVSPPEAPQEAKLDYRQPEARVTRVKKKK